MPTRAERIPDTPVATLTAEERQAFERDGFVRLPAAFARADAARMEDEWWSELAEVHGVSRADRSTWRQPRGDLKRPKKAASERLFETERVQGAIDSRLGRDGWDWPRDWGRALITFPSGRPREAWDLPERLWHWDARTYWNLEQPLNLFIVAFVGEVRPAGGGTLVLAGSPRLIRRQLAASPSALRHPLAGTRQRDRFWRSHPWLAALTGEAPGPADRIGAFMREGGEVDGAPVRVVELTGEPGDMFVCDPLILHCVAPNCGETPRMMRIKMLMSHAASEVLRAEVRQARRSEGRR